MLKRIFRIFMRDAKVSKRDFISLYILIFPILFAIGINLLTPSINDTTVELAVIEGSNQEMVDYMSEFAKIDELEDAEAVKKRVEERDNIVGILPDNGEYYILAQGNEPEGVIDFAKLIKSFYDLDVNIEDTNAELHSFGKEVPPLKTMLVNIMLLMISVLGGMLIAISIIEEKTDNTISAIHLSPVSRIEFILGKSLMGVFLAIYGSFAILLITGYGNVNLIQALVSVLACSIISILVGFIEGINNDDVMSAAGSVKIMFLPIGAAVAAIELLSDKWQMLFYWVPFYWTYKGNAAVLTQEATWGQILFYTSIVIVISGLVFALLAPKIKKGLE